jgi:hypothetical protein
MQISRGVIVGAQKIVIYGPEGIGKSSFAAKFPNAVFIDTEGSTKHMDVARLPKPTSWTMLIEEVKYVKQNPHICDTLVIDTADWAEKLCIEHLCARDKKDGLEGWGYGKGYTYLEEEFGRLLNRLSELIDVGINVVLVAHAWMRKFEQPDEIGSYDRWELKLQKKTAPLVKEWADMVLFANYKTHVINVDGQGAQKGKNKVQGGKRVIYTTHHPCWDAKNRHDLLPEIPLDYDEIGPLIITRGKPTAQARPIQQPEPEQVPLQDVKFIDSTEDEPAPWDEPVDILAGVPKQLADLMRANNVTVAEIQQAVASRGYYPADTPIQNYDPRFIDGVLVGAWEQVFKIIKGFRYDSEIPF